MLIFLILVIAICDNDTFRAGFIPDRNEMRTSRDWNVVGSEIPAKSSTIPSFKVRLAIIQTAHTSNNSAVSRKNKRKKPENEGTLKKSTAKSLPRARSPLNRWSVSHSSALIKK